MAAIAVTLNGLGVMAALVLVVFLLTLSWLLATAREDEWSAWVGSVREGERRLRAWRNVR